MHRVPGSGRGGYKVNAGDQGPKFVEASIIRSLLRGRGDSTHTKVVVFAVETDRCIVDWLSRFIEDFTADRGSGHQAEDEVFSLERGAGHDCRGELLVLFVRSRDKSASGSR